MLTPIQRKALALVELHGAASLKELATTLEVSISNAGRVLDELKRQNLIVPRVIINIFRLGLTKYDLLFSAPPCSPEQQREFEQFVCGMQGVSAFLRLSGSFRYQVQLVGSGVRVVRSFFDALANQFGASVGQRLFASGIFHAALPSLRQSESGISTAVLAYGEEDAPVEVEEADLALLALLSKQPELNHQQLAARIGISKSNVGRRIIRLCECGVIVGFTFVVRGELMGERLGFIFVRSGDTSDALHHKLYAFALSNENISYYVRYCGSWDFLICVPERRGDEASAVEHQLASNFPALSFSHAKLEALLKLDGLPFAELSKISGAAGRTRLKPALMQSSAAEYLKRMAS